MTTVNKRSYTPQAMTINGIDAGGIMTARLYSGFEEYYQSAPDGLDIPVSDKEIQYVRGSIVTQDWVHAVELITAAASNLEFYERKSGVAAATGYLKHVIVNPVIHRMRLLFNRKQFAGASFDFECKAADETSGIIDMHQVTDAQSAPTYVSAARGGYRIISATHGTAGGLLSILHSTDLEISIELQLSKECNDADVGYTCVDAKTDGMRVTSRLSFQDGGIKNATTQQLTQQLITAAKGPLVVTVKQGQAAANKVITLANADIKQVSSDASVKAPYTGYTAEMEVANTAGTPLTLDGTNKVLEITDAA